MKIRTLVPGLLPVLAVVILGWISIPEDNVTPRQASPTAFCEYEGLFRLALADSSMPIGNLESQCAAVQQNFDAPTSPSGSDTAFTLNQQQMEVTLRGTGFSPNVNLDLNDRVQSQGIIGAPYFIRAQTDDRGSFVSEALKVVCQNPAANIYVIATDQQGIAHARVFEPGEFRC